MDYSQVAGLLAGITFAVSAGWYVFDVANKKVTVSIATFFMFTLVNASQLAALINEQVWDVVPFTSVGLVGSALTCLLALQNRKIYFTLTDKIGLAGALIGFVIWQLTDDATLNIYVLNVTSFIIFLPLIIKSFKHPDTETAKPWLLNLLGSFFLLLTINSSAAVVWTVPVRQFLCSLLLNIGLARAR